MSQTTLAGAGTLAQIPSLLSERHPTERHAAGRHVLILTFGAGLRIPAVQKLIADLRASGDRVVEKSFSTSRLEVEDVDRVERELQSAGSGAPHVLISIGGGSVIDLAKLLQMRIEARPGNQKVFHVAVPTTAGTGSEATSIAVVYENGVKRSEESPEILPDAAVLDPTLLEGLSREVMIPPVLDALSQAVEALWSVRSTERSDEFAREAIARIGAAIRDGAIGGAGLEARLSLQWGANFSGRAIEISRTTLAHALSYPLTARWGIPHGLAVFVHLPRVARFNAGVTEDDCADPRGAAFVRARVRLVAEFLTASLGSARALAPGEDPLPLLIASLDDIAKRLSVSLELGSYGVSTKEDVQSMIRAALASPRSSNNPRRATVASLEAWFEGSLDARS